MKVVDFSRGDIALRLKNLLETLEQKGLTKEAEAVKIQLQKLCPL